MNLKHIDYSNEKELDKLEYEQYKEEFTRISKKLTRKIKERLDDGSKRNTRRAS